jgi:hypothetical protein
MDTTSYHYNDDVKDTEVEEGRLVVPHVYVIGVNYHFKCDICKKQGYSKKEITVWNAGKNERILHYKDMPSK